LGVLKGLVKVDGVDFLKDINKEFVRWNGPKIPLQVSYKIKKFFNLVVNKYHSEACTILYFNENTNEWKVVVSQQKVTHGGVGYKRESLSYIDGFIPVGTIHSHADFGAFHSGIDVNDEETFDGIHLTFGNNDQDCISIAASVVMNGIRAEIDPLTVLENVTFDNFYKFPQTEDDGDPEKWLANVSHCELNFRKIFFPYMRIQDVQNQED